MMSVPVVMWITGSIKQTAMASNDNEVARNHSVLAAAPI